MKVLLVCGSRDWSDFRRIKAEIEAINPDLVMTGAGGDADTYAGREARLMGIHVMEVGALWEKQGRAAGPMRNAWMSRILAEFQNAGSEVLGLAFITKPLELSRGTHDMVKWLKSVNKVEAKIIGKSEALGVEIPE